MTNAAGNVSGRRRVATLARVAVLACLALLLADPATEGGQTPGGAAPPPASRDPLGVSIAAHAQPYTATRRSHRPVRLRIPGIGVNTTVGQLSVDATGQVAPPRDYSRAGWFHGGPAPGDVGPAVLVGHIDSFTGPAVFYRLHRLAAGDHILVTRADRATIRFRVTEVRRFPKHRFPTRSVYGPTPDVALRLVTCGGTFDRSSRAYRENLVVFAVSA